jgi:hypothetical protein
MPLPPPLVLVTQPVVVPVPVDGDEDNHPILPP